MQCGAFGFGTAPLGGLYEAVSDGTAQSALEAAWAAGIRSFDTAPLYGSGLAEERLGRFLRGKPRESFSISTKVGRVLVPSAPDSGERRGGLASFVGGLPAAAVFDFSAEGIRRSISSSLERLQLDFVDTLYVHDPDEHRSEVCESGYAAARALRAAGIARAIGFGMNRWQPLAYFVEHLDVDVVLLAGRYTLLDQSAGAEFLQLCMKRGTRVVAAGIFNSGVLASRKPAGGVVMFDYRPADEATLRRVRDIEHICEEYGVSLRAAALQFPRRHPAIADVVVGMRSADEVAENVAAWQTPVPDELWQRLASSALVRDGTAHD